jgi:fumarate reductase flavoprotein subunit
MKSKRLVGLLLTVCLLVSVVACTAPAPAAVEENGIYTPGSYTASARGFGGNVEVTVTVDANAITAVTVGSNSETEGVGSKAVEELPSAIVAANGTEVDSVSGATLTSTAIKDAVNMALAQARGEEPATAAAIRFDPGTYTGTGRDIMRM